MAAGYTIKVEGLADLQRALKRADSGLYPAVRGGLSKVGQEVASEAQSIATGSGLVLTGRLVGSIKPVVRVRDVAIRASATQRGFNYPVRYEFGDRKRPFLVPAVEAKTGEIERGMENVVDLLLNASGLA
jgi:hypothetical protein